jgi:hypothetical protein
LLDMPAPIAGTRDRGIERSHQEFRTRVSEAGPTQLLCQLASLDGSEIDRQRRRYPPRETWDQAGCGLGGQLPRNLNQLVRDSRIGGCWNAL